MTRGKTWMAGLVLAALSPALRAQGPPAIFPWWEGQIAEELKLTDAQRQQVESVQREYRGKMIDSRAEMAKAELDLDDAMNTDPFDMRKANDAANRASKARDTLTRDLTQMGLRLRAVLTKEQWNIARTRFQRPGGLRGGPGVGGPRGGPRPDRGRGGPRGGPGGPGGGGPGVGGPGGPPNNQF